MPSRRKKSEQVNPSSAADAAATSEAFQELIKNAQSDAVNLGRGRGGAGRGFRAPGSMAASVFLGGTEVRGAGPMRGGYVPRGGISHSGFAG